MSSNQAMTGTRVGTSLAEPEERPLALPSTSSLANALDFPTKKTIVTAVKSGAIDPALDQLAQGWVDRIMACKPTDEEARNGCVKAVENLGLATQIEAAGANSELLGEPLHNLVEAGEEGSPVMKSILDLKVQVDQINPSKFRILEPGSPALLVAWIPWIGPKLGMSVNRYLTKYSSSSRVIAAIVQRLDEGGARLGRDNDILADDRARMRGATLKLAQIVTAAMVFDDKLSQEIEKLEAESEQRKFLEEEILFPLRQRIEDLQQQLETNQHGVISFDFTVRTNKELIRGVRRCKLVTINALKNAVTLATAQVHQRRTVDTIDAIDETTGQLIAHTAETLKKQGAEIQKQASSRRINPAVLKKAFDDVLAAVEDVSNFRRQALSEMKRRITESAELSDRAEKAIRRIEKGDAARPQLEFELVGSDS